MWKEVNQEHLEAAAFLASPDAEVTRVCQVSLVVRVCLDFPVTLSRVKDSRDSPGSTGSREVQATPGRREKVESWDSPARQDHGAMTVDLVSLATPESLVVPVEKVHPEKVMVILEVQELKASQESQVSQVAAPSTAPPVTTAFREVQVSPERREVLVKEGGLE